MEVGNTALDDELEALQAIYGIDHVSFQHASKQSLASITIHLETNPATNSTLSAQLPHDYPENAPKAPTFRCDRMSAADCSILVNDMVKNEPHVGEVCLFQYCEALVHLVNEKLKSLLESSSKKRVPEMNSRKPLRDLEVFHGEPLTDRKSVFQAHLALIEQASDIDDVFDILHSVNRKVESATHNMLAYRVTGSNGVVQDCDDDGEKGAGKCVLYVLEQFGAVGVLCIVSRWYGGTLLGPIRFRHISSVVRDILDDHKEKLSFEGD